jgi:hypothetical protein
VNDVVVVMGDSKTGKYKAYMLSKPPVALKLPAKIEWYVKQYPNLDSDTIAMALNSTKQGHIVNLSVVKEQVIDMKFGKLPPISPATLPEGTKATTALDAANADLSTRISATSKQALRSYGSSGYGGMNNTLRHADVGARTTNKSIHAIDAAMKGNKLGADVVLWRGARSGHPIMEMSEEELRRSVGSVFTEKGYGSHSTRYATSHGFSNGERIFRIHAKASHRGIWMNQTGGAGIHAEYEFVYARASSFRIIGLSKNTDGLTVIDVELIDQMDIP